MTGGIAEESKVTQYNEMGFVRRDIQHSHWSSSYITALSLVDSRSVLKYFHAIKGPIIGGLSDASPAIL